MKLRFIVSLFVLVTIFGLSANAQELPKIDASVNYSYLRANPGTSGFNGFNLNGGSASAAYNFRDWVSGVGGARAGSGVFATSNSHTAFATAFGAGVDWNVRDRFSIRPLQFDYLLTHLPEISNGNNQTQNNLRVSTGIVFHFK